MHSKWITIEELSSGLHLDESVIMTWCKNKRGSQQHQLIQSNLSPGASNQTISVKEEEIHTQSAANTHPLSLGILDAFYHDPHKPSGIKEPGWTGASVCPSSQDSQPFDFQQTCLGDSDLPWASIPYEIDGFVQLYDLPGEEDPGMQGQYLFHCALVEGVWPALTSSI
uniref:Uncharacterized protein n=1 Tax=Otolemur garnettii TaxID=30611 RepID=H0XY18_OTOGA